MRTTRRLLQLACILSVAGAVSCGGSGGDASHPGTGAGVDGGSGSQEGGGVAAGEGGGGGDAGTVATVDGVSLVVKSSTQVGSVSGVAPTTGDILVVVDLVLTDGGTTALPLLTPLFALATTSGVNYSGNALTAGYPGGCDASATLTSGHSVECSVVFQVPASATENALVYTLPGGGNVSAPLSTQTCTVCSGQCVDTQTDPANCGACGNTAKGATCAGGQLACGAGELLCGKQCVGEDMQNCGSCGHFCPQTANACTQGHCTATKYSDTPATCASLCGSLTCYGVIADYDQPCNSTPTVACGDLPPATYQGCGFFRVYCDCGF